MGVVLLLVTSALMGKEVVSQLVDTTLQQWFKQAVNTVGGIFTPGPHSQLAVLLLFRSRSFVPLSGLYGEFLMTFLSWPGRLEGLSLGVPLSTWGPMS